MPDSNWSKTLFYICVITAIVLGLYLSSLYSYILFHSLIEIVTIAIALTLFILTWNTRRYLGNNYLRLLGIGYAFIAFIDLIHTLAYKGMGVFPGYGANLPTQLWIAARYLQAVTLFTAPLFVKRGVNNLAIIVIYTVAVSALVATVHSGNFPDCFIEGKGLTAFKINSEYVITAFLLASLYLLYTKRKHFNGRILLLTASSVACTALSEIAFTAYVSVFGFANMIGHFAKLAAFYLIYRAILVTGLKEPFDLIFRDLTQAEEALRKAHDTLETKVIERTAELHASEARYRSLIHKVQTAIVLHDGQGRVLDSNPLARELLGLSEDQILGKALIDPEWHFLREDGSVMPVAEYPVSLVLSSRRPLRGYVTGISRPDRGDVAWVLVNAEPDYGDAGEIAQVIISFVGITEQKRAEEALRRLNRELRAIGTCNKILVRAQDEQTLLGDICRVICDDAGYRMACVGYAENDDARSVRVAAWAGVEDGYLATAGITWADTERGRGPLGTAIRSGQSTYFQDFTTDPQAVPWRENALRRGYRSNIAFPLKDKNANTFGGLNIYSTEPNAFTPDEIRLLGELAEDLAFGIIVLRDSAERRRAEEELDRVNRRNRLILESAGEGIFGLDSEGKVTFANPVAAKMLGYDLQELIGKRTHELIHSRANGALYPEEDCPICLAYRNGATHRATKAVFWRKNGTPFPVECTSTPIIENGTLIGAVATFRDITEKEEMEKRLGQAQKMEAIGTLAGGIAHDFNNILTPIIIHAEMALEDIPANKSALRFSLEEVLKAGERAKDLVQQILTFSRQTEGQQVVLNVEPVIKEALKLLRASIPTTIEIRRHIKTEPWSIVADPTQIHQILMNLCTNAAHAMREKGGVLEIGLANESLDSTAAAGIPGLTPGSYLMLSVGDTGHGITPEVMERIFDPYFTTKGKGEGTGLGLAVVHGIVAGLGGAITVESEPGKGSRFRVYFPMVNRKPLPAVQGAGSLLRGTEHILLVDDERSMVDAIRLMLEHLGYRVTAGTSAPEALEIFRADPSSFDLLLTDQTMPALTGMELAKEVLKIKPGIPILLCSGFSDLADEEKAMAAGIRGYIRKPIVMKEVAAMIRRALDNG